LKYFYFVGLGAAGPGAFADAFADAGAALAEAAALGAADAACVAAGSGVRVVACAAVTAAVGAFDGAAPVDAGFALPASAEASPPASGQPVMSGTANNAKAIMAPRSIFDSSSCDAR